MAHRVRTPTMGAQAVGKTPHAIEHERPPDTRGNRYSTHMTDAEIESLIDRLRHNRIARTHGEPELTDAVKVVRQMRDDRAREIDRRVGDAGRH